jgi:peptide/nickel transport system permease protein
MDSAQGDTSVKVREAVQGSSGSRGWWRSKSMKRFRRNPLAIIGAAIVIFFVLVSVFAPQLTAYQLINTRNTCVRDLGLSASTVTDIRNPLKPVFWRSIAAPPGSCFEIPRVSYSPIPTPASEGTFLGTTSGGYDIYYGLVWGTRSAFYVGVLVVGVGALVGIILGSISGFFGGWIDNVLMRFVDIVIAIPSLVLAIVIVAILGQSLQNVMIALALVSWTTYARLLRGDILQIREQDFVDGARALGARGGRLIFKHILPNAIGPLLIIASLDIGSVVLSAAALSFLGLGAPVGYADWGQMINFAREWLQGPPGQPFAYWYVSLWPGLIIILFVLGWNLLGDAARDVLDVRG